MKVLITGGTGYVGSHATAAAVAAGHDVRLLVRDKSRLVPALEPLGVDLQRVAVVVGDVTDPRSVDRAVHGVDAVMHLASVFSMDSRHIKRMRGINVPGTRLILERAWEAGADPIIYSSSYAALLPNRQPLTTDLPPGPQTRSVPAYLVAGSQTERIARELQARGAPVVIANLLAVYGPHDPHLGDQLTRLRNAVKGRLKFMPTGGFSVNDVRDVAALLKAMLFPGLGPRRFMPRGHHVSTRDYVAVIEAATGRRLPTVFPPSWATLSLCRAVDVVQHVVPWHIPAEYTAAYMCYCDAHISEEMPAEPLGVKARPILETIADSIRWLYEQGHVTAKEAGYAAR